MPLVKQRGGGGQSFHLPEGEVQIIAVAVY
jgi:hypothetical protein